MPAPPHLHLTTIATARTAPTQTQTQSLPTAAQTPILHLRGEPRTEGVRRGIRWAEDVIDNEGMGRKSSKVCCIYHPPRAVGESSSESESSSDSSSSSDNEGDDLNPETRARRPGGSGKKRRRRRGCGHGHEHGDGDDRRESGGNSGGNGGKGKGNGGNAYEKVPSAVRGKREGR